MDDNVRNESRNINKRKKIPRRSLFNIERPEDTDQWLKDLEIKNFEEKTQKWHFNFSEDKPLQQIESSCSTSSNVHSPTHVYEAVSANEVPAFYHSKTIETVSVRVGLQTPRKHRTTKDHHAAVTSCSQDETATTQKEQQQQQTKMPDPSMVFSSPQKRLRKANPMDSENTPEKKCKTTDKDRLQQTASQPSSSSIP